MGCEQRVPLWDEMEQCFASPEIQQRVRDMQEESAIELSNRSKERALVIEGLPSVSRCWVRLRAIGTAGPSPWSNPAVKTVP